MDNRNLIMFRKQLAEKDSIIADLHNQILLLKEELKKANKKPSTKKEVK